MSAKKRMTKRVSENLELTNITDPQINVTKSMIRPVVPPKEFVDGSWLDYISYFNNVSIVNGWDDSTKVKYLPICLSGQYLDFYNSVPNCSKDNFSLICDFITAKADPPQRRELKKNYFYARTQGANEQLNIYSVALAKLFKEAFPNVNDGELKDEMLRDQFIKGIFNREVRLQTSLSISRTFEDVVTRAMEVETALSIHGASLAPVASTSRVSMVDDVHGIGFETREDQLVTLIKQQGETLAALTKTMNDLTAQFAKTEAKTEHEVRARPRKAIGNQFSCWGCGSPHHPRRLCPVMGSRGNKGN